MRLHLSIVLLLTTLVCINKAAQLSPQGFASRSYEVDDEYDGQAQTPVGYRTRLYDYSNEEDISEEQQQQPRQLYQSKRPQQFNIKKEKNPPKSEEELEEEEPDRLSLLLTKSAFKCDGKTTGYYADETIGCEVFHYCQDNQRHSWICPEGFTFHQVHLICMPPSGENICEDSAKYHIVNEYLYKPINVEEHQSKPNVTLKYSERYYPDAFYQDERQLYQEERIQSHRQPIQVGFNNQIRKSPATTASPQSNPYRFATPTPQQTVFRSPEEINISLQQRRPQQTLFLPSTPRYTDEDYGYEK